MSKKKVINLQNYNINITEYLFSKNKSLQYKFAYLITKTIKILKVHKILSKNILNCVFRVYIHHDGNRIVKNV